MNLKSTLPFLLIFLFALSVLHANCQMITGVWHGRVNGQKTELKIIQKGDSLTGTCYYFESANNYRRYSIKGYFDPADNSVVWWDDQLIKGSSKEGVLSVADFSCPGGAEMHLNGKTSSRRDRTHPKGIVSLTKVTGPSFHDEWDYVIDNYTIGGNDPELIDSVGSIAFVPVQQPVVIEQKTPPPAATITEPAKIIQTIGEKFVERKKVFFTEIPVEGDSIELRFYDNVQIDGDSITLFLNDQMVFTHVRLDATPYILKLAVHDLKDSSELTMVAENLGKIPPNTAYMVAIVGDRRYDINLASTEETSAMIRLRKPVTTSSSGH